MQIAIDKNVVEFTPENNNETSSMEALWRVIIGCIKESKKLVPIGEYVPSKKNLARFVIESVPGAKNQWSEQVAKEYRTYFCGNCNKYMKEAIGKNMPLCCGRPMAVMD